MSEEVEVAAPQAPVSVTMTCMTTKKKFVVPNPEVSVLRNGRYAFTATCPWEGKNGKKLVAFKFCSAKDYQAHQDRNASTSKSEHMEESEHFRETAESEHSEEEAA